MEYTMGSYQVAVIGAGHAGIEAALAAARLGASPEECVVVEDSAYCAKTAHNAGFFVVGIYDVNTAPRGDVSQYSDIFIRTMESFPGSGTPEPGSPEDNTGK